MDFISLDTETTGLHVSGGHRLIEIGAILYIDSKPTEAVFHRYINPCRSVDHGAYLIHGISDSFLKDKEVFSDIYKELIDFVKGRDLVIHNAQFDIGFINNELKLIGQDPIETHCNSVIDTLKIARRKNPGKKVNLDALCQIYGIDNIDRVYHGALLDAGLLGKVYIRMCTTQSHLGFNTATRDDNPFKDRHNIKCEISKFTASDKDVLLHESYLKKIFNNS